jgi:tetratricopeptide (TPR) repeat protein
LKREHLAFLLGGFAFGILVGFGLFHAFQNEPKLDQGFAAQQDIPVPRGPQAPGSVGAGAGGPNAGGGAPMVARINQLKTRLQDDPNDREVLVELASLYYQAGFWEQAAGYFERLIEIEPHPDLLTNLGICYRGMKDYDRAVASFDRAFELDPTHWQSLFNKVVVASMDMGRADLTQQALRAIEAIQPRPAELDQRLGKLREMLQSAAAEREPS